MLFHCWRLSCTNNLLCSIGDKGKLIFVIDSFACFLNISVAYNWFDSIVRIMGEKLFYGDLRYLRDRRHIATNIGKI